MLKYFSTILLTLSLSAMHYDQQLLSQEVLSFVLTQSKLQTCDQAIDISRAYDILHNFFISHNIKDYADAAQFGHRNTNFFEFPDEFNTRMNQLYVNQSHLNQDIFPHSPKKYQAFIFNTSGIDVFMERLAFLARLYKQGITADNVISLVGTHAHRKDLMDLEYLIKLPTYFSEDFDLRDYDENEIKKQLHILLKNDKFTHKDGMQFAWTLVKNDSKMNELQSQFELYCADGNPTLRTEQLMEHFLNHGLKKPITKDDPIAFICNAQGAAKTKEMVNKIFKDHMENVYILIAKPVSPEIEELVFKDTPSQRAMVKFFHYYRILETSRN